MQKIRKTSRPVPLPLSAPLRKCLAVVLNAELSGKPLPFEKYRARNPKKVPLLEELTSQRLIKRDTQYTVTFWGLIRVRSRASGAVLRNCEKVYKTLARHYREHLYVPLSLQDLQRRTGLTSPQAVQCVLFLERSPSSPAIGPDWQSSGVVATERYEAMVVEAAQEGAHTLVDVTSRVLPALPNSTHYAATGRVADALARLAAVHAERERPWALVRERLEIEDWTVNGREGAS